MPFPINDPRLTQPMVLAYTIKGKAGFQLDEIVVPVAITQDLTNSPYSVAPRRFAGFNGSGVNVGFHGLLELRLLSDRVFAEVTAVHVDASDGGLFLSMAGPADQATAQAGLQGVADVVDLAPTGVAGAGQDPLIAEVGLAQIDVVPGILGARFVEISDPLSIDYMIHFPQPIIMRPGGARFWILAQTVSLGIPNCTVFGRIWEARP